MRGTLNALQIQYVVGNVLGEVKNIIIKNLSKFVVLVVRLDYIKLVAGRGGFEPPEV